MHLRHTPAIKWDTLHTDDETVIIDLDEGPTRHLVVIAREVLEDGTATSGGDPTAVARDHRDQIEQAVRNAWQDVDRLQELRNIQTGEALIHLRLNRDDFA